MYEKEQQEFAVFLNLTKEERVEKFGFYTQGDFAKDKGLPHQKLLSEWKAHPKFKKIQRELFIDGVKDLLPDVKRTLKKRGVDDGDVAALKELLKLGGFHDKLEVVSDSDIQDVVFTIIEIIQRNLSEHPELLKAVSKEIEEKLGDM